MQSALRRGDNGEYNRLVECLKDVLEAQGQAHNLSPLANAASLLKQTKGRSAENLSFDASKVPKNLPVGITIQSVTVPSKPVGELGEKKPMAKTSSVTLTATKVATIESSKTTTNKADMLITSSKMNSSMTNVSTVQAKTVSANISVVSKSTEQQQPSLLSVLQRQSSSNSQVQSNPTNLSTSTTIQPTKQSNQFLLLIFMT